MKKLTAFALAAAMAVPSMGVAGGIEPEILIVDPPVVSNPGSLGSATPWIIAGVALGLVALAASDGS